MYYGENVFGDVYTDDDTEELIIPVPVELENGIYKVYVYIIVYLYNIGVSRKVRQAFVGKAAWALLQQLQHLRKIVQSPVADQILRCGGAVIGYGTVSVDVLAANIRSGMT